MGVPVSDPTFKQRHHHEAATGTYPQAWPEPERVAIAVDAECLRRLLHSRQLCAEHFSCQDCQARACVRRMLLQNLTRKKGDGEYLF